MTTLPADCQPESADPDVRLVLACARPDAEAGGREAIAERAAAIGDWAGPVALARRHGLSPPLYVRLHQACLDSVPRAHLQELAARYHTNTLRNLFFSRQLLGILDLLAEQDVQAVPFKGPALAAACGDPNLREYGDLDILVRPSDVQRADATLTAEGYAPAWGVSTTNWAGRLLTRVEKELPFVPPAGRWELDVHWQFAPQGFRCAPDAGEVWERLAPVVVAERELLTLGQEDTVLQACMHGTRHAWHMLGLVCDLARLTHAHPELDWQWIRDEAMRFGCRWALLGGLLVADTLLGARMPDWLREQAAADKGASRLAAEVCRRLLHRDAPPSEGETTAFCLRVRERVRDRLRFGAALVVLPSPAELAGSDRSGPAKALRCLVRPARVLGKQAGLLLGRAFRGGKSR